MVGQLVWLVTGASKGLGLALARRALLRGDLVVATARDPLKFEDALFSDPNIERAHAFILALDISWSVEKLTTVAAEAAAHWGRIDILVNNASSWVGTGASEEIGADPFHRSIMTDFIGTINVTNAFLPYMRAMRTGTIIIVGSRAAFITGFGGVGPYRTTKAALHAYGEQLSAELVDFNIRVNVLLPGAFNTDPGGGFPPIPAPPIPDYDDFRERLRQNLEKRRNVPNKGDPGKGMDALVDVVRGEGKAASKEGWPLWLLLGDDGILTVRQRLELMGDTIDKWESVGTKLGELDDVGPAP
ncbi:NAD-P-binding protein [Peniophora sp. CONT]|nr:NAD-P-binding protein [Peniophora sp. CONT]